MIFQAAPIPKIIYGEYIIGPEQLTQEHIIQPIKLNGTGPEGVAILAEGQYEDVYKIDLHAGKYEALCQRNGKVRLYRDKDLDTILDFDPATLKESTGSGINIHASVSDPYNSKVIKTEVGAWSAGCQVHANTAGFTEMMSLARKQVNTLGINTFTYTLMKQWWQKQERQELPPAFPSSCKFANRASYSSSSSLSSSVCSG